MDSWNNRYKMYCMHRKQWHLYTMTQFTAPFNNIWSLKFKAQLTNEFFITVNQMFGGSCQLLTIAEHTIIKSNRRAQFRQHSQKLRGATEHLIDGSKKCINFVGWALSFRVCVLLKGYLQSKLQIGKTVRTPVGLTWLYSRIFPYF